MFRNFYILFLFVALFLEIESKVVMCSNSYLIKTTWDSQSISHQPVSLSLERNNQSLAINIQAPFFNSPEKPNEPTDGHAFNLWDYEGILTALARIKAKYILIYLFKLWKLFS